MTRLTIALLFVLAGRIAVAQAILHYAETSGFDHGTREESLLMFQSIATAIGATVVDDPDGSQFNSLASLQAFDVVVFSNTSGDALLDPVQRASFEAYIADGGSLLGIHAASDTYRHSTANGSNTGSWDFYAELLGASVQQNPNHVSGTPLYDLSHVGVHPSTANLPDPWAKEEEYYYWESGYYGPDNAAVLMVEETVGPNDSENTYDPPRPMSRYRELPAGGRVFYTALGHAVSNYTSDMLFQTHVRDALHWMLGIQIGMEELNDPALILLSDQGLVHLMMNIAGSQDAGDLMVIDAMGRVVLRRRIDAARIILDLSGSSNGLYLLCFDNGRRHRLFISH